MNRSDLQQVTVRNNYLYLMKQKLPIHLSNIIYLEAQVNYTNLHLKSGKFVMVAKTLKSLEILLSPHKFHRIHRGYLINGSHLQKYNGLLGEVTLTNDYRLVTSRRKKVSFEGELGGIN
ncbi:MAG: LytTR family DNA-binding domain-containing protein [Arcicella sp.]|nr:LytTR family DNA-binding domain-containing protein [Arcicella sp.]